MKRIGAISLFMLAVSTGKAQNSTAEASLQGAWRSDRGVMIIAGNYFSYAAFDEKTKSFDGTNGGLLKVNSESLEMTFEFHTWQADLVGKTETAELSISDKKAVIGEVSFDKIDSGKPGALYGAWLITGRMRDGVISERTPGPRKTMKILSGSRFQWIAYNSETGEFSGTGGGTYTTEEGKYTENIEFFSRDSERVGASLHFDFEIREGKWHHSGESSRGDPMHEIWSMREGL